MAGTWQVTCVYGSVSDKASLTVNHGTALSIIIAPTTSSVMAGSPQTYTASAFDSNGNNWDVTASTVWSIDSGAQGSWTGNIYTSNTAGNWVVTGHYQGLYSTSSLTVNHAPAASVTMGPTNGSVTAGSTVTFTSTASDVYGNTWNVTTSSTLEHLILVPVALGQETLIFPEFQAYGVSQEPLTAYQKLFI